MACDIIDNGDGNAALFCNTSGWAFGPTFTDYDEADCFIKWVRETCDGRDPRSLTNSELDDAHTAWLDRKVLIVCFVSPPPNDIECGEQFSITARDIDDGTLQVPCPTCGRLTFYNELGTPDEEWDLSETPEPVGTT